MRLVRILRPVVEAATDFVPIGVAQLFHRCGIRAKSVGDDLPRLAVPLHNPVVTARWDKAAALKLLKP